MAIEVRNMIPCSTGIDSVVDKQKEEDFSLNQDLLCTACEMAVVWIENQLRENKTKERILAYANEVICFIHSPILFEYVVNSVLIHRSEHISNALQLCERLPSPNGESTVSCDLIASMPNISFTIAEKTFSLTPEEVRRS